MEVSVEVHKVIKSTIHIYRTVFFTSGGNVDVVLVRLSLIEHIKHTNLMKISFSVKYPQTSSGIVNEFVQCDQNYFQYMYIPI